MSFMTINALEVPILDGSFSESIEEVGSLARSYNGALRRSRIAGKRVYEFSLSPQIFQTAEAWAGLIRGLGETWSFERNDLYGSKGTGPSSYTGLTVQGTTKKYGSYAAQLTTGNTSQFPISYPRGATAMYWRKDGAGSWTHYIKDTNGSSWVSGSPGVGSNLSFSGQVLYIDNATGGTSYFDDLVVFPFILPSTWPALLAASTSAFSDLPKLTVAGDVVPDEVSGSTDTLSMMGEHTGGENVQAVISGSWRTNARALKFRLSEV